MKVAFFSGPLEDNPNTGDTAYVNFIIKGLNNSGQIAFAITGKSTVEGQNLYDIENKDLRMASDARDFKGDHETRVNAVKNIIRFLRENDPKNLILHLQLRVPETGFLLKPSDVKEIKKIVRAVVITCHEFYHMPHGKTKIDKDFYRDLSLEYMENADSVIFLNEFDMYLACRMEYSRQNPQNEGSENHQRLDTMSNSLRTKSYLSVVPPLIQEETILLDTSTIPNQIAVLVFGMFRKNKGFEEGVALAEKLKKLGTTNPLARNIKVILAGSLITLDVAIYCIKKKYCLNDDDVNLEKNKKLKQEKVDDFKKERLLSKLRSEGLIKDGDEGLSCKFKDKKQVIDYIIRLKTKYPEINNIDENKIYNDADNRLCLEERELIQKKFLKEINSRPVSSEQLDNLEIYFDITPEFFCRLCQRSSYILKVEEKGFADNTSSIISVWQKGIKPIVNTGTLTNRRYFGEDGEKYKVAIEFIDCPVFSADQNDITNLREKFVSDISNKILELEQKIPESKQKLQKYWKDRDSTETPESDPSNFLSQVYGSRKVIKDHEDIYKKVLLLTSPSTSPMRRVGEGLTHSLPDMAGLVI